MSINGKAIIRTCLILGIVPLMIKAYEYGPPAGAVAAPGDVYKTSCVSSGCHTGTPNTGPGSVKIGLPAGNTGTYTPGQAMQILVTITDSTKAAYGFEMTARSGSGNLTQAGDFSTTDANTQVICSDDSNKDNGKACPTKFPIQYIEQTFNGFLASQNATPKGAYTYTMSWTPPAAAVGPITLYVAANSGLAGSGLVAPTDIYTSNIVLQPGTATNPNAPAITPNGIVPVYSSVTSIQPAAWSVIYGTNLATSTASWDGSFPTTLGGATVTVNGKSAYLYYASPTQINFQAPDDTATGTVPVVVTNANGSSTSTVTLAQASPSLMLFDNKHPAGLIIRSSGFDYIGPTGSSLGFATVAAKAGDTVVLFGVGFGPLNGTAPPAGKPFSGAIATSNAVTLRIAGQTVPLDFAGLSSAGLYQFNFKVPSGLGTGDVPILLGVSGLSTSSTNVISLQ